MKFSSVWTATLLGIMSGGVAHGQFAQPTRGLLPPSRMQQYQTQESVGVGRSYWDYQATGIPQVALNGDTETLPSASDTGRDVVIGNSPDPAAAMPAPAAAPAYGYGYYGDPNAAAVPPGGYYSGGAPVGSCATGACATGTCNAGPVYDGGLAPVYDGGCNTCCSSWFGGIYGLVFQRDDDYDVPLVYDIANPRNNVISSNDSNFDYAGGFEARLGRYLNDCWAVEGVYWGIFPDDQNRVVSAATYPAGMTAVHNYGALNYDNGQGGGSVPLTNFTGAQMFSFQRTFDYHNAEVNFLRNIYTGPRSSFVGLAGARYLRIDETFCLGADTNTTFGDMPYNELYYNVETVNQMVGFQIGGIWDRCLTQRLGLRMGSKIGLFGNQIDQYQRIYGGTGTDATVGGGSYAGNPYNFRSRKEDVSWVTEVFAGATYQIGSCWRLAGGYRAILASDVALPYGQIPYRFSDIQEGRSINADDTLLLHGAYAGLEYNW